MMTPACPRSRTQESGSSLLPQNFPPSFPATRAMTEANTWLQNLRGTVPWCLYHLFILLGNKEKSLCSPKKPWPHCEKLGTSDQCQL